MATRLPAGAKPTLGEAFAHINSLSAPSVDDLKVMVLLEAAGEDLYLQMASGTDDAQIKAIFALHGRQEMGHAHRVAKAIQAISGEEFPPPQPADNPYLTGPVPTAPITAEALRGLAQGEFAGEDLYERWASNAGNEEAARLFRLNGQEETAHGNRLLEAAALLEG